MFKSIFDAWNGFCGVTRSLLSCVTQGHGKAVDWWALGVLIYEMLAGYPPFYADDRMQMYRQILSVRFVYIYIYIHVYTYICMCVCVYVYICMNIYANVPSNSVGTFCVCTFYVYCLYACYCIYKTKCVHVCLRIFHMHVTS